MNANVGSTNMNNKYYQVSNNEDENTTSSNNDVQNGNNAGNSGSDEKKHYRKRMSQSFCKNLMDSIQENLFKMAYVLVSHCDHSVFYLILLYMIDFFQTTSLPFISKTNNIMNWESQSAGVYLQEFLNSFRFLPWCTRFDSSLVYLAVLYFCVFFIVALIVFAVYVGKQFSSYSQLTAFTWPVKLTKNLFLIAMHALYIPMFEILLASTVCRDQIYTGRKLLRNTYFSDLNCWSGVEAVHNAIGIVFAIFLVIIVVLASMLIYDASLNSPNADAMSTPMYTILLTLMKTIWMLCFLYIKDDSAKFQLGLALVFPSLLIFVSLLAWKPYRNYYIAKLTFILAGLTSWVFLIIFFCIIFEGIDFSGGIILGTIGLPFIFFALYASKAIENSIGVISLITEIGIGTEEQEFLAVNEFSAASNNQQNAHAASTDNLSPVGANAASPRNLKGSGYFEPTSSNAYLSHLKQRLNMYGSSSKRKSSKQKKLDSEADKILNISIMTSFDKHLAESEKARRNPRIRILYSQFLLEVMRNHNLAIAQLILAEKERINFIDAFQVFRLRKMIENELNEAYNSNKGNENETYEEQDKMQMVSLMAYESAFSQFKAAIEKVAYLHIRFWINLEDDTPDLKRLCEDGVEVIDAIEQVELAMDKMQKISRENSKALRLYMEYAKEILNDKNTSDIYAKKMSAYRGRAQELAKSYAQRLYASSRNMGQEDENGCCIISGQSIAKLGEIVNTNLALCRIFGYSKKDLLGKNVDFLMHDIYKKNHQICLEKAMNKGSGDTIASGEPRTLFVLGLCKSGYLIPLSKAVSQLSSLNEGMQFVAIFSLEKKEASGGVAYLLLNNEKRIVGLTSTCLQMTGLNNLIIKNTSINFQQLCPGMFEQAIGTAKLQNLTAGGLQLFEIKFPTFDPNILNVESHESQQVRKSSHKKGNMQFQEAGLTDMGEKQEEEAKNRLFKAPKTIDIEKGNLMKFLCKCQNLSFTSEKFAGYVVRLANPEKEGSDVGQNSPSSSPHTGSNQEHKAYFTYDLATGRFVRVKGEPTQESGILRLELGNSIIKAHKCNFVFVGGGISPDWTMDPQRKILVEEEVPPIIEDEKGDTTPVTPSDNIPKPNIVLPTVNMPAFNKLDYNIERQKSLEKLQNAKRIDYSKDVITLRLIKGDFVLVENQSAFMASKQLNWSILGSSSKLDNLLDGAAGDDYTGVASRDTFGVGVSIASIKNRKDLWKILNLQLVPFSIKLLRHTFNVILLLLLTFCISEYAHTSDQANTISDLEEMIYYSHLRTESIINSSIHILLIMLGMKSQYPKLTSYLWSGNIDTFINIENEKIRTELSRLNNAQEIINLAQVSTSNAHFNNDNLVTMVFPVALQQLDRFGNMIYRTKNLTLTDAVLQMGSTIYTINNRNMSDLPSTAFSPDVDPDTWTFFHNLYGPLIVSLSKSTVYYLDDTEKAINKLNSVLLGLSLAAGSLLIIALCILYPVVAAINQRKERILNILLDIPPKTVNWLTKRCEMFIDKMQSEKNVADIAQVDDDEDLANLLDDISVEVPDIIRGGQRKKKQYKNKGSGSAFFYFNFLMIVLVFSGYLLSIYFLSRAFANNAYLHGKELNTTVFAAPEYTLQLAMQLEVYGYGTLHGISPSDSVKDYLKTGMDQLYNRFGKIFTQHLSNSGGLSKKYNSEFQKLFLDNICNYQSMYPELLLVSIPCEELADGLTRNGLHTLQINYVESLLETYNSYYQSLYNINGLNTVLNSNIFKTHEFIIESFIPKSYNYLSNLLLDSLQSSHSTLNSIRMILFICLILFCLIGYIILWIPFVNSLLGQIWNAQRMLSIIPVEVIKRIKNMQIFISGFMRQVSAKKNDDKEK